MSVEIGRIDPTFIPSAGHGSPSERDEPAPAPQPAPQSPPAREPLGDDKLEELLSRLRTGGPNVHARLSIDHDDEAGAFVYRILDRRSGEVVRQFPAEKLLALMRYLSEQQGLVIDRKI